MILFVMVFGHIVDDYYLQGILASMKQKSWWKENAPDKMYEKDGSPFTAHTTNPVPFIVVGKDCELRKGGVLADIAPTMLYLLGLDIPKEMTGNVLIKKSK